MSGISFFGEIVQQSSRAFWDDEDSGDEHCADSFRKLKVVSFSTEELNNFSFIISHGIVANEFVKLYLLDEKIPIVAKICEESEKKLGNPSVLYKLNESCLLCVCPDISIEQANEFVEIVLPWIKKSSQVVILGSAPVVDYKCYDSTNLPNSFLRCLATGSGNKLPQIPLIETPNMVTGVPASVLSVCEILNIGAVLYVCFADAVQIDSTAIKPFYNLFNSSSLKSLMKSVLDTKKIKFSSAITNSNMYL